MSMFLQDIVTSEDEDNTFLQNKSTRRHNQEEQFRLS
jgi:hypothetical protein